jgi:lipoprotein-releasing system permease protein
MSPAGTSPPSRLRFEFWMAWRYLRARRGGPVSVITAISVIGVAAGVASLVIALAVTSGFRDVLETSLLGATPHVTLMRTNGDGIAHWRDLTAACERQPGVIAAAPAVYAELLVTAGRISKGIVLKGIVPSMERRMGGLLDHLREGSAAPLEATLAPEEIPSLLVGKDLAETLRVRTGDIVTITSPRGHLSPVGPMARTRPFRVAGVFESGFYEFDGQWALTSMTVGQQLLLLDDVAMAVGVRTTDPDRAAELAEKLKQAAGGGYGAQTWMEQNKPLFNALRLERTVTVLTLGLIVFVAALGIFNRLYVLVLEKSKDIAVLMSLGAKRRQIGWIFRLQGLLIGAFGIGVGLVLGYSFAWAAGRYRWIHLEADVYAVNYVPFELRAGDALWITASVLLISLLATLYPAHQASSVLPAEGLRYE